MTIPKLHDWPDAPFRALMIQGAWTRNAEDLKRNLELLARQHVTYFALEFGPQVVLDFDPKIAEGGRFTKAQARGDHRLRSPPGIEADRVSGTARASRTGVQKGALYTRGRHRHPQRCGL